mmetsp:Transcript_47299/g.146460  ORF Transcript_47299/g.146460 Transcript_47299/m.146460 type:complete len:233 (+) Transcript_47299:1427-2125(+)
MPRNRPLMTVAPFSAARFRRKESRTSRRSMPMNSSSLSVWPICTSLFVGEIMVILRTRRSTMFGGRSNSSIMQSGMAPPQGLQLSSLRSMRKVSMPARARESAQEAPPGPPPTTATRSFRPSGSLRPAQRMTLASASSRRRTAPGAAGARPPASGGARLRREAATVAAAATAAAAERDQPCRLASAPAAGAPPRSTRPCSAGRKGATASVAAKASEPWAAGANKAEATDDAS